MVGERIREARKEKGMNQTELAEAIGVDASLVSLWETGKCAPPPGRALDLARVLDVPIIGFLSPEVVREMQRILSNAHAVEVADVEAYH